MALGILAILAVLLASVAHADPCGPSLAEVKRAARSQAGLDGDVRWRRRARLAGLMPWLTLRGARTTDWEDDRLYAEPPDEVGNRVVFEARLSWRLDRLVYDPSEPRLAGLEHEHARARTALDIEMTTLYFRWRRAALAAESAVDDAPDKQLDAEEAWAQIEARTGQKLADRGWRCPNSFEGP
jgi:hypothetical protein